MTDRPVVDAVFCPLYVLCEVTVCKKCKHYEGVTYSYTKKRRTSVDCGWMKAESALDKEYETQW